MRKPQLTIGLLAAAAAAAGFAAALLARGWAGLPPEKQSAQKTADWSAYGFESLGKTPGRQFNLRLTLLRPQAAPKVRLLLNHRDGSNYYFIEFSEAETRIGKVENGLEQEMGARSATGLAAGEKTNLLVKRKAWEILVFLDDVCVATAFDDSWSGGESFLGSIGDKVEVDSFRFQPTGEIYFADDFMKATTETGDWQALSGEWNIKTLENPSLSTNAFFYVGRSLAEAPAVTAAGHWFWDDYSFRVACRPGGAGGIGLCIGYKGPQDYCLFRWESFPEEPSKGRKQLIRKRPEKETVLAEAEGGYVPGQWYELGLAVSGEQISASIDGNLIFRKEEARLSGGPIALYVSGPSPAEFDDAAVTSERVFRDSFSSLPPGKWQELGGNWQLTREGARFGRLQGIVRGQGKCVVGGSRWAQYRFSADLIEWESGQAGLCACYQDEKNFYGLLLSRETGQSELFSVVEGTRTVLDAGALPVTPALPLSLAIEVAGGLVRGSVSGKPLVLEGLRNDRLIWGRPGFLGESCLIAFDNAAVNFVRPPQPVLTVNEVFAGEKSMAEWASSERDWIPKPETAKDSTSQTAYWHRADFPGDVEIETLPPESDSTPKPLAAGARLTISSSGESLRGGYTLSVEKASQLMLRLYRNGSALAERPVPPERAEHLKLGRKGRWIMAYAGGENVLNYADTHPLEESRVAFSTAQSMVDTARLRVYSPNVYTYNFQSAADEWRAAGGLWEVTNRWQCDPRWSFFCGQSQQVAAIWNKREFEGDVSLDFCAAFKMDSRRGGMYDYASDINATICADGRSLLSGYSFIFGGKRNTVTQILKGDTVVGEARFQIPRQIHHRWFYVKIRKRGGNLSYWIDNSLVLEYDDAAPLRGNRVALWTYNNGLMLSRVRISSESGKKLESPDATWPAVAPSPYN